MAASIHDQKHVDLVCEFGISNQRKQALYDSGREAAEKFLSTWDFDAYLAAFRSGRTQSRTDEITTTYREAAHV